MSTLLPWPRTRRVTLAVDAPLADWLRDHLGRLRPDLRVVDEGPCELRICLDCPREEPRQTTLWIAEVERLPYLQRLSPRVWRLSPPFTLNRLQRILDDILG